MAQDRAAKITAICPDCGQNYTMPSAMSGRKVKCTKCSKIFKPADYLEKSADAPEVKEVSVKEETPSLSPARDTDSADSVPETDEDVLKLEIDDAGTPQEEPEISMEVPEITMEVPEITIEVPEIAMEEPEITMEESAVTAREPEIAMPEEDALTMADDDDEISDQAIKVVYDNIETEIEPPAAPMATQVLSRSQNLTPCPDCGRQISKRALTCLSCGCPIQTPEVQHVPAVAGEGIVAVQEDETQWKSKGLKPKCPLCRSPKTVLHTVPGDSMGKTLLCNECNYKW